MNNITQAEGKLLVKIFGPEWTTIKVTRKSKKEYDLELEGINPVKGWNFQSWLPLEVISRVDYCRSEIYDLNDEGVNARYTQCDWSFIRDSKKGTIWKMFAVAVRMME